MTNKKSPDPNQDFSAIPIITSDEIRSDSKKLIDDYCNLFEKNPNDGMASLIEDVCVHTTILAQLQQAIFVRQDQLKKLIESKKSTNKTKKMPKR